MTSKIVVNNIEADSGINTITFINEVTAPTFNGNIVGTSATFSGNVNVAGVLTYEDVTSVDAVGLSTFQNGIHVTGGNVGIGTDNPGRLFQVYNPSSNPQVNIKAASGGTCELQFGDTADEVRGNIVYNCTDDYLSLHGYNNAERLRITSAGNVGLSVTNPDLKLHVNGTNALPSSSGSTPTGHLTLRNKQGSSSHGMFMGVSNAAPWSSWIQAQDANNNATNYPLLLNPNGGNIGIGTDNPDQKLEVYGGKIFIDGGGNRKITLDPGSNTTYDSRIDASHSLVFRSYVDAGAGVKTCTFDTNGDLDLTQGRNIKFASGQGIDFSATADGGNGSTTSSEVLDDYEEGTWTPDLRFNGSNTGVSYSWRNGHYTKIGRQVTVRGAFGLSSRGTFNATDDAFIYGLPFDVAPYDITGGFNYTFGSAYNGYGGLFQIETQYSSSFSDHVPLARQTAWNSAASPMEYQDIGGSQRMAFIFTYFVAA